MYDTLDLKSIPVDPFQQLKASFKIILELGMTLIKQNQKQNI